MDTNQNMNGSKGTVGPVIGLVIILAIILIGGIYAFKMMKSDDAGPASTTEDTTGVSAEITTQGTSDEPSDIERDLDAFGPAEIDSSTAF